MVMVLGSFFAASLAQCMAVSASFSLWGSISNSFPFVGESMFNRSEYFISKKW